MELDFYLIQLQRSMSDESRLTLSSVQPSVSGKYSCEVSADAPSFHTLIESGDLEVVGKCKNLTTKINFCITNQISPHI